MNESDGDGVEDEDKGGVGGREANVRGSYKGRGVVVVVRDK
jgi:hypothetical protein